MWDDYSLKYAQQTDECKYFRQIFGCTVCWKDPPQCLFFNPSLRRAKNVGPSYFIWVILSHFWPEQFFLFFLYCPRHTFINSFFPKSCVIREFLHATCVWVHMGKSASKSLGPLCIPGYSFRQTEIWESPLMHFSFYKNKTSKTKATRDTTLKE